MALPYFFHIAMQPGASAFGSVWELKLKLAKPKPNNGPALFVLSRPWAKEEEYILSRHFLPY